MLWQNNLYNFINYTILGIGEFGARNAVFKTSFIENTTSVLVVIFSIAVDIVLIKMMPKFAEKNCDETIKTLLIFSLCTLVIVIPIINAYHIELASILIFINLFYGIHLLIFPIIDSKKLPIIILVITGILLLIMTILSIIEIVKYAKTINNIPKESPFYGAIIDENLQKEIKEVTQYIKNEEKDVIVLSSYAPFYSIILNDLENKECDWALRGNLGIESEAGFTEKIKELDNTQILLYDNEDEEEIYQFVFDTIEYIKQNMKYIGKIQNFSIYETID